MQRQGGPTSLLYYQWREWCWNRVVLQTYCTTSGKNGAGTGWSYKPIVLLVERMVLGQGGTTSLLYYQWREWCRDRVVLQVYCTTNGENGAGTGWSYKSIVLLVERMVLGQGGPTNLLYYQWREWCRDRVVPQVYCTTSGDNGAGTRWSYKSIVLLVGRIVLGQGGPTRLLCYWWEEWCWDRVVLFVCFINSGNYTVE